MVAGSAYEVWLSSNCSGTPFIIQPPPARYAFSISSDPGKYYMVPDNVAGVVMAALSWQVGGNNCQSSPISGVGIPVSSLVQVALPANPPGTPPYHAANL
jgi:hypothetical protein